MNIAVVGSDNFSLGFRLVGIDDIFKADNENASNTLEGLLDADDIAIVIVEEELLDAVSRQLRYRVTNAIRPVFVAVGQSSGEDLKEKVKRAVGIDLYKGG